MIAFLSIGKKYYEFVNYLSFDRLLLTILFSAT